MIDVGCVFQAINQEPRLKMMGLKACGHAGWEEAIVVIVILCRGFAHLMNTDESKAVFLDHSLGFSFWCEAESCFIFWFWFRWMFLQTLSDGNK